MRARSLAWVLGIVGQLGCSIDGGGPSTATEITRYREDNAVNALRWKGAGVAVDFNASLDPALDVPRGPADRQAAFQTAVDEWNRVLRQIGSTFQIQLNPSATAWAADQGAATTCGGVFLPSYARQTNGVNEASTGLDPTGGAAAGWVARNDNARNIPSDRIGSHSIHRLAETQWTRDPQDQNSLIEAEILWFTHTEQPCEQIAWDYDPALVPVNYDFYSVMLHELGHFLGLDHMNDPVNRDNVLQPMINPGQRFEISQSELDALTLRYGPQAGAQGGGEELIDPPPGDDGSGAYDDGSGAYDDGSGAYDDGSL